MNECKSSVILDDDAFVIQNDLLLRLLWLLLTIHLLRLYRFFLCEQCIITLSKEYADMHVMYLGMCMHEILCALMCDSKSYIRTFYFCFYV